MLFKRFLATSAIFSLCLMVSLIFISPCHASLSLEGQLFKQGEKLQAGDTINMTLRIYDRERGGQLLYEENQKLISGKGKTTFNFENGEIAVREKISDLPTESMWIEVESNGQIMDPRICLAEMGETSDLSGGDLRLAEAGLRTAGDECLVIDGNGLSFYADKPLSLNGSVSGNGLIRATNTYNFGKAIYGNASSTACSTSYGGYFLSAACYGRGIYAESSNSGAYVNYGGYFSASGSFGKGVYGEATGSSAHGVYGYASGISGMGVRGVAGGDSGQAVSGNATSTIGTTYGGYFTSAAASGRGVYGEASNTSNTSNWGGYFVSASKYGRGVRGECTGETGIGVFGMGNLCDFYAGGDGTNYLPFTGSHEVRLVGALAGKIQPGLIMSATGQVEVRRRENGETSLSSTLPTVALTTKAKDKAVLGVLVSEGPFPEDFWYEAGEGERYAIVNAIGEGRLWVCDKNGKIEAGDYLTSSEIPGYGQLQNDDLIHSYTVAKAIETVDWQTVTNAIMHNGNKVKVYLIAVIYTSG